MITIFDAIVKADGHGRGAAGEAFARHLLHESGYAAHKTVCRKCGDVRAINTQTGEFWNIEVKTSKKRPDGKFTFHLIQKGTDYRYSDYVLLVAVLTAGKVATFLIPVDLLARRGVKSITVSNLNSGYWSHFRVKGTVKL